MMMAVALLPWLSSCIDEDLSECPVDSSVEYRMQLSLSLQMKIDAEFVTDEEQAVARKLIADMDAVLRDRAYAMDISFFRHPEGTLYSNEVRYPDANSLSMTVLVDRGDYRNLAIGTTAAVPQVAMAGTSTYASARVLQTPADTVDAHAAAIYMGRLHMEVASGSQSFYVPLHMQNSVPVLLVDLNGSPAVPEACYVRRVANGLNCADSTFVFDRSAVMRTKHVGTDTHSCYYSVCFPSRDDATVSRAESSTEAEGGIWEMDLYVRRTDGKYTKNTLCVKDPLRAGSMEVIKVKLNASGGVDTDNPLVGVSVKLDWNPGGDYEVGI